MKKERGGLSTSIFSEKEKDFRGIYPELVEGIPNAIPAIKEHSVHLKRDHSPILFILKPQLMVMPFMALGSEYALPISLKPIADHTWIINGIIATLYYHIYKHARIISLSKRLSETHFTPLIPIIKVNNHYFAAIFPNIVHIKRKKTS